MNEDQKDCIEEITELMYQINATVKKYGLEESFVSCLAVGFLNEETRYLDEDGDMRCSMNLLTSIECENEEELDEVLSYCVEAFRSQIEMENEDPSYINYWLRKMRDDEGGIN